MPVTVCPESFAGIAKGVPPELVAKTVRVTKVVKTIAAAFASRQKMVYRALQLAGAHFGNGRAVRNRMENVQQEQANRLSSVEEATIDQLLAVEAVGIKFVITAWLAIAGIYCLCQKNAPVTIIASQPLIYSGAFAFMGWKHYKWRGRRSSIFWAQRFWRDHFDRITPT